MQASGFDGSSMLKVAFFGCFWRLPDFQRHFHILLEESLELQLAEVNNFTLETNNNVTALQQTVDRPRSREF